MLRIRTIQSAWDNRNRAHKYSFDQEFLELESNQPLDDMKMYPDIILEHDCRGTKAAFFARKYHDNDLVSFTHHSYPYEENTRGYGDAVFEYDLGDKIVKVAGPWSSGSYHWNELVPQDQHTIEAAIYDGQYTHTAFSIHICVNTLLNLIRESNLPYSLVTGLSVDNNPSSYEIVHNDDVQTFIESGGIHPIFKRDGHHRWLGQTDESFRTGIENAKVFRP